MKEEKLTVLVVEHDKLPRVKEIPNTLKALQREVDGYIEVVAEPFTDNAVIVCDEEGKFKGKRTNRPLFTYDGEIYDFIKGTFLIVGTSGEEFCSLTPAQIAKYTDLYRNTMLPGQLD